MSKPDRFTKMVEKMRFSWGPGFDYKLSPAVKKAVGNILRRQFAHIRRVVVKVDGDMKGVNNAPAFLNGYALACKHVREALDAYRKGTR